MRFLYLLAIGLSCSAIPSFAQAPDTSAAINAAGYFARCQKFTCDGSPLVPYTLKKGDICPTMWQRLNFINVQEIEAINTRKLLGTQFICSQAVPNKIICKPNVKVRTTPCAFPPP